MEILDTDSYVFMAKKAENMKRTDLLGRYIFSSLDYGRLYRFMQKSLHARMIFVYAKISKNTVVNKGYILSFYSKTDKHADGTEFVFNDVTKFEGFEYIKKKWTMTDKQRNKRDKSIESAKKLSLSLKDAIIQILESNKFPVPSGIIKEKLKQMGYKHDVQYISHAFTELKDASKIVRIGNRKNSTYRLISQEEIKIPKF